MAVWRGCEEACEAFKKYFADNSLDAQIVIRDAKRDKKVLPQFVKEARDLKADLVVTWGTSVTLGMVGTLKDAGDPRFINDIPIVFMIVADPIGAGVIKSYAKTGRTNVAGTRNRVPETVNIKTIRSYHPGFKRLGMLYNSNEKNSVLKVEEVRRITSYNVCYTKLLRKLDRIEAGHVLFVMVLAAIVGNVVYGVRITSYNVCYTKLLRRRQHRWADHAADHGGRRLRHDGVPRGLLLHCDTSGHYPGVDVITSYSIHYTKLYDVAVGFARI